MPDFVIYTSNHLEKLSRQLADLLAAPSDFLLSSEIVVVPSKGMGQWLAMKIAHHNGICANTVFPFPNTFLDMLFDMAGITSSDNFYYDTDSMAFKIMKLIPESLSQPGFEPLKQYLADNDEFKLYQLAEKISGIFDQYLIFRPDMIFAWEQGLSDQWQAKLWRKIADGAECFHRAGLRKTLMEKIRSAPEDWLRLPPRISVFGISYLPKFHLEVIAALSSVCRVHLFCVNPCCEYWGDIVTDKEKKNIRQQFSGTVSSDNQLYLETGNPLLASWGVMGREFLNLVQEEEGRVQSQSIDLFEEIADKDLLTSIQSDIFHLKDRTQNPGPVSLDKTGCRDESIQIHSCHSRLREIEVLHNQLLAMFEKEPKLLPGDILVMAPDMAAYEPFIHAVFGHNPDDGRKIPYHVSDKSLLRQSALIDGFLLLLDLPKGRFGVTQVMALLDIPGIKEKFGLTPRDIGLVENWVTDTNIRWGIDASHKSEMGLPEFKANTWDAGFQSLLLGYAMPGHHQQLFSDILPYDHMEGSETGALGCFLDFFTQLVRLKEQLVQEKTLEQWAETLNRILEDFFQTDDDAEEEKQILRRVFEDLALYQKTSENTALLGIPVIASFLKKRLSSETSGAGFITGNVTFCTLLPFRSIPAKIICMIGMNGDAFPREYFQPGFDLVAQFPRPGDRIKRNDDKYLFLQALVSCRDTLYISYVGQSNRENTQLPPCVLVDELVDYMVKGFGLTEDQIITRHRLQSFAKEYFEEKSPLFSYSVQDYETCLAAKAAGRQNQTTDGFIHQKLSEPEAHFRTMDLEDLGRFYSHPAKYLLENRLGIYLKEENWTFEEEEPFKLTGLDRYQVARDIFEGKTAGILPDHLCALQRAGGRLPHGTAGDILFSEQNKDAGQYMDKLRPYETTDKKAPLEFFETIGDFTVKGSLTDIYKDFYLYSVYARSKSKYLLRAWINHLGLCLSGSADYPKTTILICKDITWRFHRVENSTALMEDLLSIYLQGLMSPMVFFPEASWVYAKEIILKKKKTPSAALHSAVNKWTGNDFAAGEASDPYVRLCFPDSRFKKEINHQTFQETALRVFSPLLEHCEKL